MIQYCDTAQFTRLLAEISMAGPERELIEEVATSMDLEPAEVYAMLSSAEKRWESIKNSIHALKKMKKIVAEMGNSRLLTLN